MHSYTSSEEKQKPRKNNRPDYHYRTSNLSRLLNQTTQSLKILNKEEHFRRSPARCLYRLIFLATNNTR